MTPKQQRFVEEYLVDGNATQAAIRAGYSEKTASAIGHENLKKPEIAAALQAGRQEITKSVKMDAEWVLAKQGELYVAAMKDGTAPALNVAARVLRDVGDYNAMYVEKHEHKHSGTLTAPEREQRVLSLVQAAAARKKAS